jgi:hypothetical protein
LERRKGDLSKTTEILTKKKEKVPPHHPQKEKILIISLTKRIHIFSV